MKHKFLLEAILEHLDEGILVVDPDANVTFFNEPATDIAGITPCKAVGKNILEIFPDLTPETSTFYRVLKTKKPIIDYVQTYMNYQRKIVSTVTSTLPLIKDGELVGALEIYRDLTAVMDMADKISILQKELYQKDSKQKPYKGNGTIYTLKDIVGRSPAIEALKSKAAKVADSSSPVLVYGETGTGKELVVQAIHNANPVRKAKPFIAQNCAAIPQTLLEGILFGTSAGSFTGARDKPGLFELAGGGTLFLDEIDSMDMELQTKLLRILQDGIIRRIGSAKTVNADVRVMASCSEHPLKAVEGKTLREDLYYRLNVINLYLPPLRERKEDIPLLTSHFIGIYNRELGKNVTGISPGTSVKLQQYDWPGNVRELRYTIEGIMNFIEGNTIDLETLPPDMSYPIVPAAEKDKPEPSGEIPPLENAVNACERELIKRAVEQANGNYSKAARLLKVPRQTLHNKIKKHGISWKAIIK
jgi:arginine utilization regulatory protein